MIRFVLISFLSCLIASAAFGSGADQDLVRGPLTVKVVSAAGIPVPSVNVTMDLGAEKNAWCPYEGHSPDDFRVGPCKRGIEKTVRGVTDQNGEFTFPAVSKTAIDGKKRDIGAMISAVLDLRCENPHQGYVEYGYVSTSSVDRSNVSEWGSFITAKNSKELRALPGKVEFTLKETQSLEIARAKYCGN